MGAVAASHPRIRCRTPASSAETLRRYFAFRQRWDDRFHALLVDELGLLVQECRGSPASERVVAHLRSLGSAGTTHPEIARAVGLSRETVTRALIALLRAGRVRSFALRSERGAAGARRVYQVIR